MAGVGALDGAVADLRLVCCCQVLLLFVPICFSACLGRVGVGSRLGSHRLLLPGARVVRVACVLGACSGVVAAAAAATACVFPREETALVLVARRCRPPAARSTVPWPQESGAMSVHRPQAEASGRRGYGAVAASVRSRAKQCG